MIDRGLLLSVIVGAVATWAAAKWWSRHGGPSEALDHLLVAGLVGLAVGRLSFLVLDDPSSITRVRDLMVIRSGVDFWPAVAAGGAVTAIAARRHRRPVVRDIAELTPLALVAYGMYELTCLVRDGCFGPRSPIGLVPPGLSTRMLPLGLFVGGICVAAGLLMIQTWSRWSAPDVVVVAVVVVSGLRSLVSFWLPKVSDGLTRPHRSSLIVLALTIPAVTWMGIIRKRRSVNAGTGRDQAPPR